MVELSWFVYAIFAAISYGIFLSLYKMPSSKNQSKFLISFIQHIVGLIISLVFFFNHIYPVSKEGLLLSLTIAVLFVSLSLSQMYTLKYINTSSLFPITTTGSLVLAVLGGLFLFGERISLVNFLGIFLVIAIIFGFIYQGKKIKYSAQILFIISALISISAVIKIFQKFIADSISIPTFLIYEHLFASLLLIPLVFLFHKKDLKQALTKRSFITGSFVGLFGFLGFYTLLTALSKGPLTLISPIQSTYILVTAIVSAILYKEKLTKRTILLILLAVLSIFLIKFNF
ncbi:hypothetical protein CMI47_00350 [Candidatus Pacearchaeota archaeon]|nr:hypothetical protein [Candidatus Pacearchaeota archaeon]|tara:strand:- start:1093 stop:1953 length:861 start_codon:yes stop_codon:yes gene_type:complete